MTFLSLFAGIGGIDLGLERAGMRCIGQVEIDPYCRAVLAKHWPDVPRFEGVRTFHGGMLNEKPDLICGGFPCQDISNAGHKVGISGERSGLWSQFYRIICDVRPQIVFVENVSALLIRGIDRVLGDLATGGYDAEWDCIPACAVGAPHIRDRVWIVAHAARDLRRASRHEGRKSSDGCSANVADTKSSGCVPGGGPSPATQWSNTAGSGSAVADTQGGGLQGCVEAIGDDGRSNRNRTGKSAGSGSGIAPLRIFSNPDSESLGRIAESRGQRGEWATEPDVGRVANGVPSRVDRLRALGNAVVPQVAQFIGERIMKSAGFVRTAFSSPLGFVSDSGPTLRTRYTSSGPVFPTAEPVPCPAPARRISHGARPASGHLAETAVATVLPGCGRSALKAGAADFFEIAKGGGK